MNNPTRQHSIATRAATLLAALGLLLTPAVADAGKKPRNSKKVDAALSAQVEAGDHQKLKVIVTAKPGARARVRQTLEAAGHRTAEHPLVDGLSLAIDTGDLAALAADDDVVAVSLDAEVRSEGNSRLSRTLGASTDVLKALGVGGRGGLSGKGVGVAILDSGIQLTKNLKVDAAVDFTRPPAERVVIYSGRGGWSKPKNATNYVAPDDGYGHGTHVAGLIASQGIGFGGDYEGIAPGVRLIDLQVLDGAGVGQTSAVIDAIDFAVAHRADLGIDILNLSLGHPIYESAATDPLVRAVERAVAAGLVVVVSAGNIGTNPENGEVGYAGITSPGNAPSAITVGALDTRGTLTRLDDVVTPYSSRGPTWYDGLAKPDLVAPGHRLVSNAAAGSLIRAQSASKVIKAESREGVSEYVPMSGTSMAAAVTSGVVALMIEASRDRFADESPAVLTPNAIKAILQFTSLDVAGADLLTQGAGALNGEGAVRLASSIDPGAVTAAWWLAMGVDETSCFTDDRAPKGTPVETLAWARRIIWGDRIVWGDAIYVNEPAWGQRIIWGDAVIQGDRIIWGDRIVWGDRIIWGDRIVWGDQLLRNPDGTPIIDGDRIIWGDLCPAGRACGDRIIWSDLSQALAAWPGGVGGEGVRRPQ